MTTTLDLQVSPRRASRLSPARISTLWTREHARTTDQDRRHVGSCWISGQSPPDQHRHHRQEAGLRCPRRGAYPHREIAQPPGTAARILGSAGLACAG
jgi:hypothetical protein